MPDEGVHEIQLNGKQLVFLFMALTVFSVVVFLSGVMVGRGVRPPQPVLAADASAAALDPTLTESSPPAAPAVNDRAPVSTQESLTYADRLEAPQPPPETLSEPVTPARSRTEAPEAAPIAAPAAPPAGTKPAADSPSLAEPRGDGFAVQVGAYPRGTAEAIAKGLAAKGFPSFVTPRERGLFAVRVGKYPNRREAEAVARRLERDEQFNKPWVTR